MTYNVFSGTLNPTQSSYKSHDTTHLIIGMLLPWKIKNSNFPQIFRKYGRKCKQIAFWVHQRI